MTETNEMIMAIEDEVNKSSEFITSDAVKFLKEKYGIDEVEAMVIIDEWTGTDFV